MIATVTEFATKMRNELKLIKTTLQHVNTVV